ncbi:MAG TPA: FAD-binding oxidoreductase [Nitrososphaerales archaeon]|nr:FAD-binding oxidoreductase [Nitrososphaerales archaeon]
MRTDILVIGAGIMGMASACHLKKNNPEKKVLVIDRYGAPGQGNTGRSNSMFRNTFSSRDNQVLSNSSIDFYLHLQDELKIDIGMQKIGYLWLMDEGQLSASEPHLRLMERNGIEITRYSRKELKRLLPGMVADFGSSEEAKLIELPTVDGGVFGPKCGRLDPDKLVRFYAREFVSSGGELAFNTEAESLLVGPSKRLGIDGEPFVWQESLVERVATNTGTIEAEVVVLAGGAWENELLEPIGLESHAKAKKRQLFSIRAKGEKLEALLRCKGFNALDLLPLVILPKSGVHFKPVSEEGDFWVACEDQVNRPFIDLPEHDLEKYQAEREYYEKSVYPILTSYFPDFVGSKVRAMWAGLYSYNTIDSTPFAFRHKNLIVVGGDSGSGIMKGDALGRIVDALYREEGEANLYGDVPYATTKIGFDKRDVEKEEWVI